MFGADLAMFFCLSVRLSVEARNIFHIELNGIENEQNRS